MCVVLGMLALGGALGQDEAVGALRGKVTDEDFGDPLLNARITVQELNQTVNTGDGGAYVFENVPPGVYTLTINKGGYERKFRREVLVRPGQLTEVNESLVGEVFELEELVVEAEDLVGGSEVELLSLRTETTALVDAVGSDLLSKAGASDAADAVKLIVGVTVSEDKTATVRGLGDRYTVTTLNGGRVPSSNPVKRAVELDQFPTSLVESISVSKTFLPDMQGEATGGGVDIKTKAIPDGKIAEFSASVGFDSQATGNDKFRTYEGAGEPLGIDFDDSRGIPVSEGILGTNVGGLQNAKLTDKFEPIMGTTTKSPEPNQSYGISIGDRIRIDDEQAVGYLFNMDYGKVMILSKRGGALSACRQLQVYTTRI
ncbi:MAG: TonB-dependent receptor plug domain-containing protein [Verrucomicrobiae bacterium]|nr:TonB-dependent receptor plug domain-containing protein [Verrucomicrobiae bacterium]